MHNICFAYLEESKVRHRDVVKGDPRIDPERPSLIQADSLVGDDLVVEPLPVLLVDALLELAHECVDPDDGEDQPEYYTHG